MINKAVNAEKNNLWAERYEQLRQASGEGDGLGFDCWALSLLRRQGVVGWMEAWRDPVARAQELSPPEPLSVEQSTSSCRHEVTLLLTNMALSHVKGPLL